MHLHVERRSEALKIIKPDRLDTSQPIGHPHLALAHHA